MTETQSAADMTFDIAMQVIDELKELVSPVRRTVPKDTQLAAIRNVVMIDRRLQPSQLPSPLYKFYQQVQDCVTDGWSINMLVDRLEGIALGKR